MPQLGLREKLQHGGGQQVCRGVAINLQRLLVFLRQDAQLGVFFQRPSQINQLFIRGLPISGKRPRFGHQRGIRQARAYAAGNLQRRRPFGDLLHAAIGQLHFDLVRDAGLEIRWKLSSLAKVSERVKPGLEIDYTRGKGHA